MIDIGTWGLFWQMVADKTFDLSKLKPLVNHAQSLDLAGQARFVRMLVKTPPNVYKWVMLQAGTFGGKQININGDGWTANGFRNIAGNRCVICRSPQYVYDRIATILAHCDGLQAYQGGVSRLGTNTPVNANKVYIDPPYTDTTKYAHSFDLTALVNRLTAQGVTCYVSESKPLSENAHLIGERSSSKLYAKGQPTKRQEWLTVYPPC